MTWDNYGKWHIDHIIPKSKFKFKSIDDAADDEVLSALRDRFGFEGYGIWWLIVEIISKQIHDGPRDFAEYSEKKWHKTIGISSQKFHKLLAFMEKSGRISVENSEKDGIKYLKIKIPKILEIADEYTKKQLTKKGKSGQTPDKIRSNSRKNPPRLY